ncbi:ParB/RepB/Spo0J family partition protein [Arthrobacter luteolus]|uniref:ParB/RepB/Spo0J family partition protein n=1 Tax=Arthrobacter luteolus TaxID=98672 RepID=UPI000834AF70|nr:ParB/RepB/Spo0J family partition protein [Arthrobacter luteolus]
MEHLELVNPAQLTIDANVRADVQLDKEFLASIKEHGVLQPVIAQRKENGGIHVLFGQRRTLAAVENNLTRIPVYIVDSLTEADRMAKQVVENDQRQALTEVDRAEAFHQLSLLGVSATQIARKTGAKKTLVEAALKVRANDTATAALAGGMTLEMAAVIEEFSDDAAAVEQLERAAANDPQRFNHTAQRIRDDRKRAAEVASMTAEIDAQGLTVVTENVLYYDYKGPMAPIGDLRTAAGEPLTIADANGAYIGHTYNGELNVVFLHTDWKAAGLTFPGRTQTGGPMTEEEKAERRTVIENNKAWDAAEKVRLGFLKDLLAAKSMPKDALQFIAQAICTDGYTVSDGIYKYSGFTAELLGGSNGFGELARVAEKPGRKADSIILASFLAGYEQNLSRQSWRTPTDAEWRYLTKLGEWGYALSDVERIITEK